MNFAYYGSTEFSITKHISTQFRFKDGTFVLRVAWALRMPLTGLLNCLTGDIWQANLSGHLRDTAREKNISSDLAIHMQIHSRGDIEPKPPGEPYNFTADTHMLHAHKGKYCKDAGVTLTPLPQKMESFCLQANFEKFDQVQ